MRNHFCFLFILLFSFFSCKTENNEEYVVGEFIKIEIELPDELQNQITRICPIARLKDGSKFAIGTSYKKQNGFELHLQDPLDPIFLFPLKEHADFLYGEKDNDVMCYGSVDLYAYKENKFVGTLRKNDWAQDLENRKEISYWLHSTYVTDDVAITGNCIIAGKPFKSYHLNLKRGWNLYMSIQTIHYTLEGGHDYTSYEYTSEISDNLVWGL